MPMKRFPALVVLLAFCLLGYGPAILAQEADPELERLRALLSSSLEVASQNQIQILALTRAPMPGMVEVELNTGEILYTDISGEYMFAGDLFRASPDGLVNLSADTRKARLTIKIAAIPESEMIIFEPETVRATLTVFTDVDCTYCRALHRDVEQLMDLGVRIRYLAYPRGGEAAGSFTKMIAVWCSRDRQKSLTQAKNGQNLPEFECDNPVLRHYALGNEIGISGTPAIVLEDGSLIPGYMDVERMAAMLGLTDN